MQDVVSAAILVVRQPRSNSDGFVNIVDSDAWCFAKADGTTDHF